MIVLRPSSILLLVIGSTVPAATATGLVCCHLCYISRYPIHYKMCDSFLIPIVLSHAHIRIFQAGNYTTVTAVRDAQIALPIDRYSEVSIL